MSKKKLVLANNPLFAGPALGERERVGIPYRELQIESIDRDPKQPRQIFDEEKLRELSESIKVYGVLSPVLVRPSESKPGRYNLIAGERRLRATQLAGKSTIPALVDQQSRGAGDTTLAMQLVENLQRADLAPIERAQAIGALKDSYQLSVRDIAEKLGVSKSMVQRSLELLELPDDLLNALREGASESKVLLLAKIEDPEIRASYLRDLDVLTRGQLEKDISKHTTRDEKETEGALTPEDQRIADEIQRALGLKVKMSRSLSNREHGRLSIEFYSDRDLQEVFRKLIAI